MSKLVPIDTDVLLKIAAWQMGNVFISELHPLGKAAALGLTHLIAPKQLTRMKNLTNLDVAEQELQSLLTQLQKIEPTEAEATFASELEDTANQYGFPFDRGESQLLSIVLLREFPAAVTGDKRATTALSPLLHALGKPEMIRECILCLEQILLALVKALGIETAQGLVCQESKTDKAISICLRCGRTADKEQTLKGLTSYIQNIRTKSNGVLIDCSKL